MIGDINLFVCDDVDSEPTLGHRVLVGELEIMIADGRNRGKGYGKSALLLFMSWILKYQMTIFPDGKLIAFLVKIGSDNRQSIDLFESIGFVRTKYVEVFSEWELKYPVEDQTEDDIARVSPRKWKEMSYSKRGS